MSTAKSTFNPIPNLTFRLGSLSSSSKFSPRLGQLTLTRPVHDSLDGGGIDIDIPTPGLMCTTTRGVIQHLSRDNIKRTSCVKWVHVPFESFLQVDPPVPTRQEGSHPLHTFLGFPPAWNIVSMSLRDPADGREMPPNGKLFVAAQSSRGTRKVACPAYRSYVTGFLPDVVFPLSDVPFSAPPHSQKRISKSIERSTQWLATILAPLNLSPTQSSLPAVTVSQPDQHVKVPRLNVFLPMVGGIKPVARAAFATALQEPLEQKEKELLVPLETLDDGVSGYVFDLVSLRTALLAEQQLAAISLLPQVSSVQRPLVDSFGLLIKASLEDLPATKPRLVNTTHSPHEVLTLIRDAGVDLFDTFWAQRAATWGVALDFRFPVSREQDMDQAANVAFVRDGRMAVGHNLYEGRYAHDFGSLADSFVGGLRFSKRHRTHDASDIPDATAGGEEELQFCLCAACSPMWENDPLTHSIIDEPGVRPAIGKERAPSYTRAYVHHLLHTHEMSAHALLVMHNLTVMDAFMHGVRGVLKRDLEARSRLDSRSLDRDPDKADENADTQSLFTTEVARFEQTYDASLSVLDEARACWAEVDLARGKGRLARERARKLAKELGADVSGPAVAMVAAEIEEGIQE